MVVVCSVLKDRFEEGYMRPPRADTTRDGPDPPAFFYEWMGSTTISRSVVEVASFSHTTPPNCLGSLQGSFATGLLNLQHDFSAMGVVFPDCKNCAML